MNRRFLLLVVILISTLSLFAQTNPAADFIIRNAKIWTVDRSRPEAEAVAILGARIVAVGSNQEVDAWRGARTRELEAGGKRLLPGFDDAHVHFMSGGAQLDNVQLNDAASPQEFARRIGQRATMTAKGEWVQGGDWDETKWNPAQLPTKEMIDPVTGQTPVAVGRYDGHMILANSLALKLAGISGANSRPGGRSNRPRCAGESDGRAERCCGRPGLQSDSGALARPAAPRH